MKTIWRFFSRMLSSFLCAVLLLCLLFLPLISFVAQLAEPRTLVDLISSFDIVGEQSPPSAADRNILLADGPVLPGGADSGYSELLGSLPMIFSSLKDAVDLEALAEAFEKLSDSELLDMAALAEELGIPADVRIDEEKLIRALAQSDAVKVLISTYAEDVLNAATDMGKAPILTADTVIELLSPHMEELAGIVEDCLPEEVQIDSTKLTGAVKKATSATLPVLVESLPPAEEMASTVIKQENPVITTIMDAIRIIRSGSLFRIVIIAIAVLCLLIFLLRLPGFSGLQGIGVQALIAGILSGAIGFVLQASFVKDFISSVAPERISVFDSILSGISTAFMPYLFIYGIAGILLLVGSGILNHFFARVED